MTKETWKNKNNFYSKKYKIMSVDMNLLKQLREATFAPLKDCKDALVEAD
jgi:hypothetical protein